MLLQQHRRRHHPRNHAQINRRLILAHDHPRAMRLEIRAQRRNEMLAQLIARPLGPPGIPRQCKFNLMSTIAVSRFRGEPA